MHTLIVSDMLQDNVDFSLSAKQQTHLHIIFLYQMQPGLMHKRATELIIKAFIHTACLTPVLTDYSIY